MIKEELLNKNQNYVVAVSGGPDSMFLLNWLVKLKYTNLIALHVNYNKRKDSYIDEKIFLNYCQANKLNHKIKNVQKEDYNLIKKNYKVNNFQQIARIIRYDFFSQIAKQNNAKILVAHNLNDLIETYLIQKKRKTIVNFWGIKENSLYKDIEIIRPMLQIKKTDIIEWLKQNNVDYAIDYTNNLDLYTRNKIRKTINDNDLEKYLKLIELENKKLLIEEKNIKKYYNIVVDKNNHINLKKLYNLTKLEKEKIIHKYLVNNDIYKKISKKKQIIKEFIKQLNSKKPNVFFNLNNDLIFVKEYDKAFILKKSEINLNNKIDILIKDIKNIDIKGFYKISFLKNKDLIDINLVNGYYCYLDKKDFPIKFTNDVNILKDVKINSKSINRFLIKEKVPLLKRKNPIFLNYDSEVLLLPEIKTIINDSNKDYVLIILKNSRR